MEKKTEKKTDRKLSRKSKSLLKAASFAVLVLALAVCSRVFGWTSFFSDAGALTDWKALISANLPEALLLYTVVTIIACVVLALPGITFAVLAGVLFGPLLGTFVCLFACTLGASAAFLCGRFFLRDSLAPLLEKNRLLKKLLFSGNQKNDITVLMITRLVPLFPYNLQNFAYGITDMRFATYTVCTFIFMLPGVALYTFGAAGLVDAERRALYFGAAAVLFAVVTLLGLSLKKKFLKRDAYILMTRIPQPGKTKTRLMPVISGEECCRLHTCFLQDLAEKLHLKEPEFLVYYLDDCGDAEEQMRTFFPHADAYLPQKGEDLGRKMAYAFETAFSMGYERAVLTGADIPELSSEDIEAAFSDLKEADAVLNPTEDGGYYLIGLCAEALKKRRKPLSGLLAVTKFSTADVFSETLAHIQAEGLSVRSGKRRRDIDTPEDLIAVKQAYASGGPCRWRHTEAFLKKFRLEKCR